MIDTSKYEGHSTGWKLKMNNSSATIWNDEGHKVATTHYYDSPSNRHDRFIIEDSLKLLAEVKRLREIIQVQIVTPRSKDFFFRHYGKNDFEERWKEWADGIQDRVWGRKK